MSPSGQACAGVAAALLLLVSCGGQPRQAEVLEETIKGKAKRSKPKAETVTVVGMLRSAADSVREHVGDSVLPPFTTRALDSMATVLSSRLFMVSDGDTIVETLNRAVFEEAGVAFDPDQDDILNLFPHTVLEHRKGSCLGISLLYLQLAEKLDVPIHGVLAPEHFFVRFDDGERRINIEPIKRGKRLSDEWYRERYELSEDSRFDLASLSRKQVRGALCYNVGNYFRAEGASSQAADWYEQATADVPSLAEAWGNLGIVYETMDRPRKALAALKKARSLDPELSNISRNLGALYVRLNKHERAIDEYQEALDTAPRDPRLHYGLACAWYGAGDLSKAVTHARKALTLKPDFPEARELVQRAQPAAP